MTNTIPDHLVDKVEKILALRDSNTTEGEIQAAVGAISRLLAKNNITHEEMSTFIESRRGFQKESLKAGKRNMPRWKSGFAYRIAPYFFCASYSSWGGNIMVTGKKDDREAFIKLLGYIFETIDLLAIKAIKEYTGWEHGKTYGNNFRIGCCERLIQRINEENAKVLEQHTEVCSEKGIVAYDPYKENTKKIKEFYEANGIKLRSSAPSASQYSRAGYSKGFEAGNNIGLNTNASLPGRR
jgi:hypothetical protein